VGTNRLVVGRALFAACLFAAGSRPSPADQAAPGDASDWLRALQRPRTVQASFTQTRHMRAFKTPMEATGRLVFARPDRLRWEYTAPYRMVLVAGGGRATLTYPDLGRRVSAGLSDDPAVGAVIDALLFFRHADAAAVARRFHVSAATEPGFDAVLVPIAGEARNVIDRIEAGVDAPRGVLRVLRLVEPDGDVTSLSFRDVRVDEPIAEALLRP
jgi:outer membrane lipoprotein-sorting protein